MSTKTTIAHGENFHFYRELFDYDHVYLQVDTTHFEAGYGHVMIPIPIHIWETIRHLGAAELDLVDLGDEQLLGKVEKEVEERVVEYQRVVRERPNHANLFAIMGSLVYGPANEPRDDQIRHGMDHFRKERLRQREIRARILSLRSTLLSHQSAPGE
jgi:hypothetical protein